VSRHHILPPVIYSPPPPKPKETKRKRGVGYASATEATGEAEETSETSDTAPARASALPQQQRPVEATERRVPSPNGKLSDDTLKAMLEVQEQEGTKDAGSS
jgi:hypothetical protein